MSLFLVDDYLACAMAPQRNTALYPGEPCPPRGATLLDYSAGDDKPVIVVYGGNGDSDYRTVAVPQPGDSAWITLIPRIFTKVENGGECIVIGNSTQEEQHLLLGNYTRGPVVNKSSNGEFVSYFYMSGPYYRKEKWHSIGRSDIIKLVKDQDVIYFDRAGTAYNLFNDRVMHLQTTIQKYKKNNNIDAFRKAMRGI